MSGSCGRSRGWILECLVWVCALGAMKHGQQGGGGCSGLGGADAGVFLLAPAIGRRVVVRFQELLQEYCSLERAPPSWQQTAEEVRLFVEAASGLMCRHRAAALQFCFQRCRRAGGVVLFGFIRQRSPFRLVTTAHVLHAPTGLLSTPTLSG